MGYPGPDWSCLLICSGGGGASVAVVVSLWWSIGCGDQYCSLGVPGAWLDACCEVSVFTDPDRVWTM